MVRKLICILLLIPVGLNAQEENGRYVHEGLFCARGSIGFGKMLSMDVNNIYLDGNIEYYFDPNFSWRGDGFFFINSVNGDQAFSKYHSLFSGIMYHIKTNSHFDPYVGMEVGINIAQASDPCLGQPCIQVPWPADPELTFTPLFSPILGFNYFGDKWFHIVGSIRYVAGRFMDNYNSASLGELRFSFGLGFNLSLLKKNKSGSGEAGHF